MSCCGKSRGLMMQPGPAIQSAPHSVAGQPRTLEVQYTGKTAITAVGRVTGRQYRFGAPGARVAIDPRDRASIRAVPNLREVR
jgi:hypothetical protein